MNSDHWIQSPECSPLHHGTFCTAHLWPLAQPSLAQPDAPSSGCLSLHPLGHLAPSAAFLHGPQPLSDHTTLQGSSTAPSASLPWPLLQVPGSKPCTVLSFPNGNKLFLAQGRPWQVTFTQQRPLCLLFSSPSHSSSLRTEEKETLPHLYKRWRKTLWGCQECSCRDKEKAQATHQPLQSAFAKAHPSQSQSVPAGLGGARSPGQEARLREQEQRLSCGRRTCRGKKPRCSGPGEARPCGARLKKSLVCLGQE